MSHANPHADLFKKSGLRSRSITEDPFELATMEAKPEVSVHKENQGPPKSSKERFEDSKNTTEERLTHFYRYQFFHPRFAQVLVFFLGIIIMACALWLTISYFQKPKPIEPIYTKIEAIKRLGEMHLVKQKYESIIPITRQKLNRREQLKKEQLQFLLIAPIEVSGYIDFSALTMQVAKRDSLVQIALPAPQVSKAYLDFSKTEEFLADGKFRIFGKYLENINHEKAYYDIARGINGAKEKVRNDAIHRNNIKKETHDKAKTFLQNFVNTMGYRVEFRQLANADSTMQPESIDQANLASEIEAIKSNLQKLAEQIK